jgi:hypothetical protein
MGHYDRVEERRSSRRGGVGLLIRPTRLDMANLERQQISIRFGGLDAVVREPIALIHVVAVYLRGQSDQLNA